MYIWVEWHDSIHLRYFVASISFEYTSIEVHVKFHHHYRLCLNTPQSFKAIQHCALSYHAESNTERYLVLYSYEFIQISLDWAVPVSACLKTENKHTNQTSSSTVSNKFSGWSFCSLKSNALIAWTISSGRLCREVEEGNFLKVLVGFFFESDFSISNKSSVNKNTFQIFVRGKNLLYLFIFSQMGCNNEFRILMNTTKTNSLYSYSDVDTFESID